MCNETSPSRERGERTPRRGPGPIESGFESTACSAARYVAEVVQRPFFAASAFAAILVGLVVLPAGAGSQWQRIQLRSNLKYHSLVGGLAFSPDDRFVWTITGNPAEGGEVRVVSVRLRREVARLKLPDGPHWDASECAWGRAGVAALAFWPYDEGASVFLFDARPLGRWLAGGGQPRPREQRFPQQKALGYPPGRASGLALSPGESWLSMVAGVCDLPATENPYGGVLLVERATGTPVPVAIPGTTCCPAASFVSDDELDVVCLTRTSKSIRWYVVRRQGRAWSVATRRDISRAVVPHPDSTPANPRRDAQGRLWFDWPTWSDRRADERAAPRLPTGILCVVDSQGATVTLPLRRAVDRIHLRDSSCAWIALTDGSVQEVRILPGPAPRLSVTREIAPPPPARQPPLLAQMAISKSERLLVTGEPGDDGKGATLWLWERAQPTPRRRH
jgi:hypothetical protein